MTARWKRLLLRSLGIVVPVARDGSSERAAMMAALRLLEGGAVVALFPEGRVSRTELGELAPFARGVRYLALKAGVPVLPVWLRGTAELYLGRELVARVGDLVATPSAPPTKAATQELAATLHDALSRIALPLSDTSRAKKRWCWLTHLF